MNNQRNLADSQTQEAFGKEVKDKGREPTFKLTPATLPALWHGDLSMCTGTATG